MSGLPVPIAPPTEESLWPYGRTEPASTREPHLLTMSIGGSPTVGYPFEPPTVGHLLDRSLGSTGKGVTALHFGSVGRGLSGELLERLIYEQAEALWAPTEQIVHVIDVLPSFGANVWRPTTTFTVTIRVSDVVRNVESLFDSASITRGQINLARALQRHAGAIAPPAPPAQQPSAAFRTFSELRGWLRLTANEAADLIGVGRTTPNAWEREGFEPRARTARTLYQLHTTLRALISRLGEDEALRWLETGIPSPRERLLAGDQELFIGSVEERLGLLEPSTAPEAGSLISAPERISEPQEEISTPRRTHTKRKRSGG